MPFDNPHQMRFGDVDVLLEARNRISIEDTWVKKRFRDGDRYCLVAALSLASGSRSFNVPNSTEQRLARLLARQLSRETLFWARIWFVPARDRLMSFNDNAETTHGEVMAVFNQAISDLASKSSVAA